MPRDASRGNPAFIGPLPVDQATALAQWNFKLNSPTHIRDTNLYPPHHHCSDESMAQLIDAVAAGAAAGGAAGSRANPTSQHYAMLCLLGRHWFGTVQTGCQVQCNLDCKTCKRKVTPLNKLVFEVTRSGPLGTLGDGGRDAAKALAGLLNQTDKAGWLAGSSW